QYECSEIMHSCCKNSSENNPQQRRQPAPINSNRRPDNRSCSCNRTEVVSPQNKLIRRNKVDPIFITVSWCDVIWIELKNFFCDKFGIKAVTERKNEQTGSRKQYTTHHQQPPLAYSQSFLLEHMPECYILVPWMATM